MTVSEDEDEFEETVIACPSEHLREPKSNKLAPMGFTRGYGPPVRQSETD
jgi:hypothetical protein